MNGEDLSRFNHVRKWTWEMFFRPWHLPHFLRILPSLVTPMWTAENERWISTALICWLFSKQPRENLLKKKVLFFCKRHLQTWKLNLPPFGISRSKRTCAHFWSARGSVNMLYCLTKTTLEIGMFSWQKNIWAMKKGPWLFRVFFGMGSYPAIYRDYNESL